MRPTLYGSRHAVSCGHYLGAAAAFAILEAGGNAIDAGCCAGMALAVLHPDEVSFAGVAPILIRLADSRTVSIDGLGHWPRGIPADYFMRHHNGEMPFGVLRTVVPAAPSAWITALRDYGTMSFSEVAAAAIGFAREGFAVYEFFANEVAKHEEDYRLWPSSAAIFLPDGRPPRVGERFFQTDLAATITYMCDEEKAAAGKGRIAGLEAAHAAFYRGDIAQAIAKHQRQEGGFMTYDDIAAFRARYEPPLHTRWRDKTIVTCGPWCQGPTLAQALVMADQAGIARYAHNEPAYIHLLTEIIKSVFSDREYHFGDPGFVDVGLERLFSEEHMARRIAAIRHDAAMPHMPPGLYSDERPFLPARTEKERDPDTSFACVIDSAGNAFAATPSDGSWRSPIVPGLGLVPSARGTQSRPDPTHPSGVAPGKRPRLTPNPAMIVGDDGVVMPIGAPGGDSQVQGMLQVTLNLFQFGMDVQQAIDAPRFISQSFPSSFAPYSYHPGVLALEDRFDRSVYDHLAGLGHKIRMFPPYSRRLASVEAIIRDPRTGFIRAGADPREPAYAIVH